MLIAATNKPENLRQDFKERFHILPIPPLQQGDIPALACHFLGKPLTDEVVGKLTSRMYSGNVRGLKRACEALKVESKKNIFAKKPHGAPTFLFDYDRYRRELNTWNKYIQPVIDHYKKELKIEQYQYKYQGLEKDPLEWLRQRDKISDLTIREGEDGYDEIFSAYNLYIAILNLNKSINENFYIPANDEYMISCYDDVYPENFISDF